MEAMCCNSDARLDVLRGMAARAFAIAEDREEGAGPTASFKRAAMRLKSKSVGLKSQMSAWFS
eukprot:CAMPEP_0176139438 /NCGR_PEP_ID=MMETSP0120_2-20121206/70848_1 /TAXON_ID=160619 /ORGANISM="Kryptoperidinium foliaceum, Strain CCMP 1326" /LENGTH=62 /DNA_ID=CAMNT_0017475429 /DNA_START=75 /DNA_END=259 /DNA_ORIENTATION=-